MNLKIRQAKPGEYEKIVDLYQKEGSPARINKIRADVKRDFDTHLMGV